MSLSHGQLVEGILCLIDENPRPNILFSAPAISLALLERNFDVPYRTIHPDQAIQAIQPLCEGLFDVPRIPRHRHLKRGKDGEDWIVFEKADSSVIHPPKPEQSQGPLRSTAKSRSSHSASRSASPLSTAPPLPPLPPHGRKEDDQLSTRSRENRNFQAAELKSRNRRTTIVEPATAEPPQSTALPLHQPRLGRTQSPTGFAPSEVTTAAAPSPMPLPSSKTPIRPKTPVLPNSSLGPQTAFRTQTPLESTSAHTPQPQPSLRLPPTRRTTRNFDTGPPSAPLPPPITLHLETSLPGGGKMVEPGLRSAVSKGEKERKRGFLRVFGLGRKKRDVEEVRRVGEHSASESSTAFVRPSRPVSPARQARGGRFGETRPRHPDEGPEDGPKEVYSTPLGFHHKRVYGRQTEHLRRHPTQMTNLYPEPQDSIHLRGVDTNGSRTSAMHGSLSDVSSFDLISEGEAASFVSRSGADGEIWPQREIQLEPHVRSSPGVNVDQGHERMLATRPVDYTREKAEVERTDFEKGARPDSPTSTHSLSLNQYDQGDQDGRDDHQNNEDEDQSGEEAAEGAENEPQTDDEPTISSSDGLTPPPTPFLTKAFEGLPFGPDVPVFRMLEWLTDRWQLVLAEMIAVLALAYVIQASGL